MTSRRSIRCVKFVADAGHLETMDHLGVGSALGIGIDSCG